MTAPALPRSTALIEAGREWGQPLTEGDARDLTAQIRTRVQEVLPLIRTAYERRADLALGYASWEAYCDGELVGLRLSVADRQEAVAGLRGDGMSQRAIGAALGISAATVNRTLATVSSETVPERITGTDGREQPATRPTQSPGPVDAAVTPPADPGANDRPVDEATPVSTAPPTDPRAGGESPAAGFAVDGGAGATPAPAAESPVLPPQEPASSPALAAVPSAAQASSGPDVAAAPREGGAAAAPKLQLVPTADEKQAAVQRDARGLLRRALEILAPAHDRPGFAETWARQLGPYDAELSDLIRRAREAMTTLDDLIEGCGQ